MPRPRPTKHTEFADVPPSSANVVVPVEPMHVVTPSVASVLTSAPERMVRIRNLTDQMLEFSVRSAGGVRESLRLNARDLSNSYREAMLDDYTLHLVARGFLKIETAR